MNCLDSVSREAYHWRAAGIAMEFKFWSPGGPLETKRGEHSVGNEKVQKGKTVTLTDLTAERTTPPKAGRREAWDIIMPGYVPTGQLYRRKSMDAEVPTWRPAEEGKVRCAGGDARRGRPETGRGDRPGGQGGHRYSCSAPHTRADPRVAPGSHDNRAVGRPLY